MDCNWRIALVCLTSLGSVAWAAETRGPGGVAIVNKQGKQVGRYSGSYALLIGVSDYTGGWPDLPNISAELKEVEAELRKHGFEIKTVVDPDDRALRGAFKNFIDEHGYDKGNRLLVFFSGHGHSRRGGSKGYLVPANAPDPRKDERGFLRRALPMSQVLAWCRQMEAKHALLLFDSCFSGTIFKTRALPQVPPHISDLTARPVRQFISAGDAGEVVPAKSVFVPCFVRALRGAADLNHDGYVTGVELGMHLHDRVLDYHTGQTPQYGKIRDPELDEGDFVFALKRTEEAAKPPDMNEWQRQREELERLAREKKEADGRAKLLAAAKEAFKIAMLFDKSTAVDAKKKAESWEKYLHDFESSGHEVALARQRLSYWAEMAKFVPKPGGLTTQCKITETRVNDYTKGRQFAPCVSALTNGNYVVGWLTWGPRSGSDCMGRLYGPDGRVLVKEFLLNATDPRGWQYGQAIAPLPDGGFAVAWDANSSSCHSLCFDSKAKPVTRGATCGPWNTWPAIASDSKGNFVVAGGTDQKGSPVYARAYRKDGTPTGQGWRVNEASPGPFKRGDYTNVSVAAAPDGTFAIAWYSLSGKVLVRRFTLAGKALGPETVVNSSNAADRPYAAARYNSRGELLVVWHGHGGGDSCGIFARWVDASGQPKGKEWRVNEKTEGSQNIAQLAMSRDDEFVVAWNGSDGSNVGVFARIYDASGSPLSGEFRVNRVTDGRQALGDKAGRTCAAIAGTTMVFVWEGKGPGDDEGIFVTRFEPISPMP